MQQFDRVRHRPTVRAASSRGRRLRPLAIAVFIASVLGIGAAALQQLQAPPVANALFVAAAATASLVSFHLRDRLSRAGRLQLEMRSNFLAWSKRGGPTAADVADMHILGITKPSAVGHPAGQPSPTVQPTQYVGRTVDGEIDAAIRTRRFVLVIGDAKAGKSRTAFEAVRRVLPEHLLLAPASPSALAVLDHTEVRLPDAVIWLDELDRYLCADGLSGPRQ